MYGYHIGGVLGIVLFYSKIKHKLKINIENENIKKIVKTISEMLIVTISAELIILPIMAFCFNKISILFWLSNLIASPIIAICLILGFITIFVSFISMRFAKVLILPVEILLNLLNYVAKCIANIPFSNITVITPSIIFIMIYYIILFIVYRNAFIGRKYYIEKKIIKILKMQMKNIIIILFIVCIIFFGIKIVNFNTIIYFIDVGQGDSTLIVTAAGKKILIDGGGSDGSYDVGKLILLPYLLDRGISKIDYAMISHFDSDHCLRSIYCYGKYKS